MAKDKTSEPNAAEKTPDKPDKSAAVKDVTKTKAKTLTVKTGKDGKPVKAAPTDGKSKKSPIKYLREVRAEFRRVQWPKRKQVFGGTVVVLVSVAIMSIATFGLDTLFNFALRLALRMT
ncbi:MAG: preprotein translocase subunit SecE [Oscillospiraceae bacterium]|jgi:preprotein translocase subunit SecE|nr:preprotein translocase subunit SecE [Oscillospiraceae bacterium]